MPPCPCGNSANPAFPVLEWRYDDQLEWRLVVIGLGDEVSDEMRQRLDPAGVARPDPVPKPIRHAVSLQPKARAAATGAAAP